MRQWKMAQMANEPTVKEDQVLFCFFSIDKPESLAADIEKALAG